MLLSKTLYITINLQLILITIASKYLITCFPADKNNFKLNKIKMCHSEEIKKDYDAKKN